MSHSYTATALNEPPVRTFLLPFGTFRWRATPRATLRAGYLPRVSRRATAADLLSLLLPQAHVEGIARDVSSIGKQVSRSSLRAATTDRFFLRYTAYISTASPICSNLISPIYHHFSSIVSSMWNGLYRPVAFCAINQRGAIFISSLAPGNGISYLLLDCYLYNRHRERDPSTIIVRRNDVGRITVSYLNATDDEIILTQSAAAS